MVKRRSKLPAVVDHYDIEEKCDSIEVYAPRGTALPIVGLPNHALLGWLRRVHTAYGDGKFASSPRTLPRRKYVKVDDADLHKYGLSRAYIRHAYCQRKPDVADVADLIKEGAMPARRIPALMRDEWLCIRDVAAMAPGEKLDVAVFDRNWGDVALNDRVNAHGVAKRAPDFLRRARATFQRSKDPTRLSGTLVHATVMKNFEFDVQYKAHSWYPLVDGALPARDEQTGRELLGKSVPWTALPPSTPVGWRGPMVRWKAVEAAPDLFHVSGHVEARDFEG